MTESESVALPFGDSPMCFSDLFSRLRHVVLYISVYIKVNPFFQIFSKNLINSIKPLILQQKKRFPHLSPCAFHRKYGIIKQNIRAKHGYFALRKRSKAEFAVPAIRAKHGYFALRKRSEAEFAVPAIRAKHGYFALRFTNKENK